MLIYWEIIYKTPPQRVGSYAEVSGWVNNQRQYAILSTSLYTHTLTHIPIYIYIYID